MAIDKPANASMIFLGKRLGIGHLPFCTFLRIDGLPEQKAYAETSQAPRALSPQSRPTTIGRYPCEQLSPQWNAA